MFNWTRVNTFQSLFTLCYDVVDLQLQPQAIHLQEQLLQVNIKDLWCILLHMGCINCTEIIFIHSKYYTHFSLGCIAKKSSYSAQLSCTFPTQKAREQVQVTSSIITASVVYTGQEKTQQWQGLYIHEIETSGKYRDITHAPLFNP